MATKLTTANKYLQRVIRANETRIKTLQNAIEVRNERETKQVETISTLQRNLQESAARNVTLKDEIAGLKRVLDSYNNATAPNHRILRVLEYVGPRAVIEDAVKRSLHGTRIGGTHENAYNITAVTLHEYPEVIRLARKIDATEPEPIKTEPLMSNAGQHGPY